MNRIEIIGRLGRDPEVRSTPGGGKVCNFSVATSERWRDKTSGEQKERTQWHRVTIWNEALVGVAEKFLHKGDVVFIAGQMEYRKYTGQDGIERDTAEIVLRPYAGEIHLLPNGRTEGGDRGAAPPRGEHAPRREAPGQRGGWDSRQALDDDIPF